MSSSKEIIIIGGGPAGLFCAYELLKLGHKVNLYDQSSGLGKKFLVAGNGGMNLTHSENLHDFASRYGKDEEYFKTLLKEFSPQDMRDWYRELGVETFIGSSRRVFPTHLKSAPILKTWIEKIKSYDNFHLFLKHRFKSISSNKELIFEHQDSDVKVKGDIIIFGMGGASWKKTGSDGLWMKPIEKLGLKTKTFLPMNCGFERPWSNFLKEKVDRSYLKNIQLCCGERKANGEILITPYGVEGGGVYALSNFIRDEIKQNGHALLKIDFKPQFSEKAILEKIQKRKKGMSFSHFLKKSLKLDKTVSILFKEIYPEMSFENEKLLAERIKSFELPLLNPRPLDEAISTSGGVCFSELNEQLESTKYPGVYFVGEMLDFEAPTGGYLLQACFSTGWKVIKAISH